MQGKSPPVQVKEPYGYLDMVTWGKRELIALLNLSSWCLVMVERLFLAVPRGCLQFVIVVFPDHTHLLFFILQPGIAIHRKERSFRGRKVPFAEGRFLYGRKLLNKFISKIIL